MFLDTFTDDISRQSRYSVNHRPQQLLQLGFTRARLLAVTILLGSRKKALEYAQPQEQPIQAPLSYATTLEGIRQAKMGAKFWTPDEKQVFLDDILPRSRYALPDNDSGERLDWEELVPIMQKVMDKKGGDRIYTKTSLFQHYYQKVGSRAQQRGEADTMTISRHQQRARTGTRNMSHSQSARRQNFDGGYSEDDEYGYGDSPERTPSPDLPSIRQSLTKNTSRSVSKAGRPALFVEDTDDEIKVEENTSSQLQSLPTARSSTSRLTPKPDAPGAAKGRHAERRLRNDESLLLGKDDFMDDENDIPGLAFEVAYDAAQLLKGERKKEVKKTSKKRNFRSQNPTIKDEKDVEFVPRKRQILPRNVHPREHSDDDYETLAVPIGDRLVSIQSKNPRPRGRQTNKPIPVGKARYERNGFIMIDSDNEDEDDRSSYQSRDRYASSSGYYANQGARSRHDEPRQARHEHRTEQSYHYPSRDRDPGRYAGSSSSMYRKGISASAFDLPPERAEKKQRLKDGQASSTSSYGPTTPYRGSREFSGNYPGMGRFQLSDGRSYLSSENANPYASMNKFQVSEGSTYLSSEHANHRPYANNRGRTVDQGGFAAVNQRPSDQRFSYSDRAQNHANRPSSSTTSSRRRYVAPPSISQNLPLPPRSSQASRSLAPIQPSIRRARSAASSTVRSEQANPRTSHNAGPDPATPRTSHVTPGARGPGPARAEPMGPAELNKPQAEAEKDTEKIVTEKEEEQ